MNEHEHDQESHPFGEPLEPLADHMSDTGRVVSVRAGASPAQKVIGALALLGALGLTVATVAMLIIPTENTPAPQDSSVAIAQPTLELPAPTAIPEQNTVQLVAVSAPIIRPTINPELASAILNQPLQNFNVSDGIAVERDLFNPFTIIPDRPRTDVIEYEVQEGDTIFSIAERFGLKPETIAWSNDRSIIGGLRPGQQLNILPVDGAYWTVPNEQTVTEIAAQFGVDAYTIIDSEYNTMFGITPESTLPVGTRVIVPGGEAETITWTPRVERSNDTSTSGGGGGSASAGQIAFELGDPGSCGWQDNPGSSGAWARPMGAGSYQWSRGFTSWHTGLDLAAPPGTPIMAATDGTVIFAGWNNYGYGNLVVIASGSYTTVYAHMSAIYAGCGQYVSAGTTIGAVGASGNASGPHLHFEIRVNDTPTDPTYTMAF
jgi:murein DD-endopeptidase MepM/ murein hydrolase activator NlpD